MVFGWLVCLIIVNPFNYIYFVFVYHYTIHINFILKVPKIKLLIFFQKGEKNAKKNQLEITGLKTKYNWRLTNAGFAYLIE
jgi:5-bromo-4-chloroindolyl phosphate hydrolysis protein